MTSPFAARAPITLFYDGGCALCRRQVGWLERHRHRERIRFIDIRADGFDPAPWGRDCDELMGRLYALDGAGHWFAGMESSRALYAVLGHRWLVRLTCLPGLRPLLDALYMAVARRRNRLARWLEPDSRDAGNG
ncbi:Predicted thiol-disulfide oxidoreductase YuxK, DCC family [Modicisalibacter ilicicola DSM 19980]|uniref:Predicted thiol-disulfide oxidoreductase YuxK, DCC family n=1 Tax=Modicisalibacter ilicicola DSM 19980 TaxID=1121942 RepID=A0A1M4UIN2_9GAMM|nr:DUF393 domain-containing protein [Halomonas ilicicola]SHE56525.1 Predicted thiol-disulfide oxidoreductase YuxK, DCC family [Halomonas ilicicola DSM 19980]